MLNNYNYYFIIVYILVNTFINSKVPATPLIKIILKFILQFENYWMIINADPI